MSGETQARQRHAGTNQVWLAELGIQSGLTVVKAAPHPLLGKQVWFDEMIETADEFFAKHLTLVVRRSMPKPQCGS